MYNNRIFIKYWSIKFGIINFRYVLPLYIHLSIFYSCQQNLDIEIKTNDKLLLVNGEFSNDSVIHSIRLYCSGSLITGRPQKTISGAKVFVTDKIDTFYYIENPDSLGLYQTLKKCRGIVGRNYYLSISNIDVNNDGKLESYSSRRIYARSNHYRLNEICKRYISKWRSGWSPGNIQLCLYKNAI